MALRRYRADARNPQNHRADAFTAPTGLQGLDELRATIHSFITAASQHPEVGRLINHEGGGQDGERLKHLLSKVLRPGFDALGTLLRGLADDGAIHPVTAREVFFLAQAGVAPFNLHGLSGVFDAIDGPLDPAVHVESVTELLMRGIRAKPE